MKNLMAAVFMVILSLTFAAQEKVNVGEDVEYKCNCFGKDWVRAKVEAVRGNSVKVRFGNLDNQVVTLDIGSDLLRLLPKPERPEAINLRNAFRDEAASKYGRTVAQFAHFYDSRYLSGGFPVRQEGFQKAMQDMTELDALCKTRYAGVTDGKDYLREGSVDYRYSVWCKIAANRNELEKVMRNAAAKNQVSLAITDEHLRFAFSEPKNRVHDETQMLMYERAKWRAEQLPIYKPRFAEYGVEMPTDFSAEVEKRADELKAIIERDAPNRNWEDPPHSDPAVESFIRGKFAAEYPGAKVLKSGLDYKTWVVRKGLSYQGSDSTFRYYKVEYNSYKRGWVLLKMPNRPYCQAQEWIVGRGAKGIVAVSVGGSGIFMKCQ